MKKLLKIIIPLILIIVCGLYLYNMKKQTVGVNSDNNNQINTNSTDVTTSPKEQDPSKGTIVDVNDLKQKMILVEKHYLNYAFSFDHKGTILCTDGTIYNYAYSKQDELPSKPYEKISEESDDVISHVTTFEGRVSEDDLALLKDLLGSVTADYEYDNVAMDQGEDTIIYYDYEDNEIITLKSTGDSIVKNNSKNITKILKTLDYYHIRIDE